jgi:hypothetical protein
MGFFNESTNRYRDVSISFKDPADVTSLISGLTPTA